MTTNTTTKRFIIIIDDREAEDIFACTIEQARLIAHALYPNKNIQTLPEELVRAICGD